MEKEVRNFDAIGVIRIGTSITIGNYLLPSYVTEFKQTHPQMEVKVVIDNSDKIQQHVLSNQIDIGIIEGIVHSPYIIERKFRDDELQNEDFILREAGSAGREIFDSTMIAHGLEISPAWESTSTQAIVRAVQAKLGISVLPYLLIKDSLDRKEINQFQLNGIRFQRSFSVIYHRNKFLAKSAKDFIALCK